MAVLQIGNVAQWFQQLDTSCCCVAITLVANTISLFDQIHKMRSPNHSSNLSRFPLTASGPLSSKNCSSLYSQQIHHWMHVQTGWLLASTSGTMLSPLICTTSAFQSVPQSEPNWVSLPKGWPVAVHMKSQTCSQSTFARLPSWWH